MCIYIYIEREREREREREIHIAYIHLTRAQNALKTPFCSSEGQHTLQVLIWTSSVKLSTYRQRLVPKWHATQYHVCVTHAFHGNKTIITHHPTFVLCIAPGQVWVSNKSQGHMYSTMLASIPVVWSACLLFHWLALQCSPSVLCCTRDKLWCFLCLNALLVFALLSVAPPISQCPPYPNLQHPKTCVFLGVGFVDSEKTTFLDFCWYVFGRLGHI